MKDYGIAETNHWICWLFCRTAQLFDKLIHKSIQTIGIVQSYSGSGIAPVAKAESLVTALKLRL